MKIIKNDEINANKNVLLYTCLNEKNEEIGKVHILFFENDNNETDGYTWNIWETFTCNKLNDYLEFKSNQIIKEELKSDIKDYINYHDGDKVSIIVYPISDDSEVLREMVTDLMQKYSILKFNKKTKMIEVFDL